MRFFLFSFKGDWSHQGRVSICIIRSREFSISPCTIRAIKALSCVFGCRVSELERVVVTCHGQKLYNQISPSSKTIDVPTTLREGERERKKRFLLQTKRTIVVVLLAEEGRMFLMARLVIYECFFFFCILVVVFPTGLPSGRTNRR